MTLSKDTLERAVMALLHRAQEHEIASQDDRWEHKRQQLAERALINRAAAQEILDYLDTLEEQK